MFTSAEEIAAPDVADNFLPGPSWHGAGPLCHPSDELPISCLITELTDFFTNAIKISGTVFALLVSRVYTESNSALASSPAFFVALEARSQPEWPSAEAQGSSSLAPPPPPWAVWDNAEVALGCAAPWEELPRAVLLQSHPAPLHWQRGESLPAAFRDSRCQMNFNLIF